MNKKKISQLLVVASTVVGTTAIATEYAYATENNTHSSKKTNYSSTVDSVKVQKGQVINITTNLRIREDINKDSKTIGYLMNGDIFEILDQSNGLYHIKSGEKEGYIPKEYVKELNTGTFNKDSKETSDKTENVKKSKGKVINVSTNLRLRKAANYNSDVVGYVINGQTFDINNKDGDWYNISLDDKSGYIHKDYVEKIDENKVTTNKKETSDKIDIKDKDNKVSSVDSNNKLTENKKVELPNNDKKENTEVKQNNNKEISKDMNTNLSKENITSKPLNNQNNLEVNKSTDKENSNKSSDSSKETNSNKNNLEDNKNNSSDKTNNYKYVTEEAPNNTKSPATALMTVSNYSSYISKGQVINVSSSLRVREGAGTNTKIVGYLNNGQTFDITGKSGDWYYIKSGNTTGYVHKDYVKEINSSQQNNNSNSTSTNTNTSVKGQGQVINVSSSLRIREGASTNTKTVGYLYANQTFEINGKEGNWYHIKSGNVVGYVHEDYVKVISNSSGSTNSDSTNSKPSTDNSVKGKIGQVVNVSSSLRIRKGAGTNTAVVGTLYNGQTFDINGKEGDWYYIKSGGTTGYVHKDYVKIVDLNGSNSGNTVTPPSNSDSSVEGQKGQVVNVSSSLRIREGAGTNTPIIGTLYANQTFDINGKSGDWYYITSGNIKGYVHKDYVKIISNNSNNSNSGSGNSSSETVNSKGKVINVSTNLRIRKEPNTNSSIVGYLVNGDTFDIISKKGNWYYISHQNKTGHVHEDYVQLIGSNTESNKPSLPETSKPTKDEYGMVYNVSTNLRLRSNPSTNSSTIAYLLPGETFKILGVSGEWYNINYKNKIGYVHSNYVKKVDSPNNSNNNSNSNGSSNGSTQQTYEAVLSAMKAQIGSPYVWGGAGEYFTSSLLNTLKQRFPSETARGMYDHCSNYTDQGYRAFDCSGLMQWGFRQAGIRIGRTTWDQINNGFEVSLNSLKPGDLLFYSNLQHVGMYLGNGQWIESPNSRSFVKIADVPWHRIGRARRVL